MIKFASTQIEAAPKGKRTIRESVSGNVNAYIGGKFWKVIGPSFERHTDEAAQRFLDGMED